MARGSNEVEKRDFDKNLIDRVFPSGTMNKGKKVSLGGGKMGEQGEKTRYRAIKMCRELRSWTGEKEGRQSEMMYRRNEEYTRPYKPAMVTVKIKPSRK